MNSRLPW